MIRGDYESFEHPQKAFLLKYFETEVQIRFLSYILLFGSLDQFRRRTGVLIDPKYRASLCNFLSRILSLNDEAKKALDFETFYKIDSGNLKKSICNDVASFRKLLKKIQEA